MTLRWNIERIAAFSIALTLCFVAAGGAGQKPTKSPPAVPAIRVDSAVASDSGELNRKVRTLESPSCNGGYRYFDHPTVLADLVGGKANSIRVVRLAHRGNSPTPDELRATIKKVWQGTFRAGFCQIAWAEYTSWSIEAVIEFEDGKESTLVTDGVDVALQDHEGKSWFFRLYPAAQ
jgi:hypothetical protein